MSADKGKRRSSFVRGRQSMTFEEICYGAPKVPRTEEETNFEQSIKKVMSEFPDLEGLQQFNVQAMDSMKSVFQGSTAAEGNNAITCEDKEKNKMAVHTGEETNKMAVASDEERQKAAEMKKLNNYLLRLQEEEKSWIELRQAYEADTEMSEKSVSMVAETPLLTMSYEHLPDKDKILLENKPDYNRIYNDTVEIKCKTLAAFETMSETVERLKLLQVRLAKLNADKCELVHSSSIPTIFKLI